MALQGRMREVLLGERKAFLYLPPDYERGEERYPVVYVQDGESFAQYAQEVLGSVEADFTAGTHRPFLLAAVCSHQRNGEYTPWPAARLPGMDEDFSGQGDAYLEELVHRCKTALDTNWRTLPNGENTGLVGLSLGGLITLYALTRTAAFGRVVSISGSLWYPGWKEYLEKHPPMDKAAQVLLTCGKYEGRSRFSMGLDALDCTRVTADRLGEQLGAGQVTLHLDNGKHHDKQVSRYRTALRWFSARG